MQTAARLQLDEKNVRELADAGKLPARKIGPEWRFSRAAVLAWLEGDR
jgi:excisionase family DNA binding protein